MNRMTSYIYIVGTRYVGYVCTTYKQVELAEPSFFFVDCLFSNLLRLEIAGERSIVRFSFVVE